MQPRTPSSNPPPPAGASGNPDDDPTLEVEAMDVIAAAADSAAEPQATTDKDAAAPAVNGSTVPSTSGN